MHTEPPTARILMERSLRRPGDRGRYAFNELIRTPSVFSLRTLLLVPVPVLPSFVASLFDTFTVRGTLALVVLFWLHTALFTLYFVATYASTDRDAGNVRRGALVGTGLGTLTSFAMSTAFIYATSSNTTIYIPVSHQGFLVLGGGGVLLSTIMGSGYGFSAGLVCAVLYDLTHSGYEPLQTSQPQSGADDGVTTR